MACGERAVIRVPTNWSLLLLLEEGIDRLRLGLRLPGVHRVFPATMRPVSQLVLRTRVGAKPLLAWVAPELLGLVFSGASVLKTALVWIRVSIGIRRDGSETYSPYAPSPFP